MQLNKYNPRDNIELIAVNLSKYAKEPTNIIENSLTPNPEYVIGMEFIINTTRINIIVTMKSLLLLYTKVIIRKSFKI